MLASATRRCCCAIYWLLLGVFAVFLIFLWGGLHNNAIVAAVPIGSLLFYSIGVCTSKQVRILCPGRVLRITDETDLLSDPSFSFTAYPALWSVLYNVLRISVCCQGNYDDKQMFQRLHFNCIAGWRMGLWKWRSSNETRKLCPAGTCVYLPVISKKRWAYTTKS